MPCVTRTGAIPLPAGCGPCVGLGKGLLQDGEVGISATNRNFKGRMGSPSAEVCGVCVCVCVCGGGGVMRPHCDCREKDNVYIKTRPLRAGAGQIKCHVTYQNLYMN